MELRLSLGISLLLGLVVCCSTVAEGCLEKERSAILRLRDAISGPGKVNSSEWPTWVGEDCCQWEGISCRPDYPRRVVGIDLSSKRTSGKGGWEVDGSLFASLEKLQTLNLQANQLTGWTRLQGMAGLGDLQRVNLGENNLTGDSVSWIFRLPSIEEVDLSFNKLSSSLLLKGFCGMKKLTSLRLGQNMIEGKIDPCITFMPELRLLDLQDNRFTGEIPSFANAASMETLILAGNRLSGAFLFSSLAGLRNLTGLSLSLNSDLEVETETLSWTPSFQLTGLLLAGCPVNRRSGHLLPTFLSSQQNLQALDLRRTSIKGTLPAWLFENPMEILLLGGNNFTGPIPRLASGVERRLSLLDLSENGISGPLPPNMGALLPRLYHLNISGNAFRGSMESFAQLHYLGVLDASHNELEGEIPAALAANGSRLSHLNLGHNKLTGRMLPKGSVMKNLNYLILENNLFAGGVSRELSGSPELLILNLRGNRLGGAVPGELFALPELAAVFLGGNGFRGGIPRGFCGMKGLRMLDLSANSFSGEIPGCLSEVPSWRNASKALLNRNFFSQERVAVEFRTKGKLRVFEEDDLEWFTGVDLSLNQLGGGIPEEIGEMAALRSLNISHNRIGGGIPVSFGGLELVESVDLSHNQLSGRIPREMGRLPRLTVFCVAFNKLVGDIPPCSRFLSVLGKGCF